MLPNKFKNLEKKDSKTKTLIPILSTEDNILGKNSPNISPKKMIGVETLNDFDS